MTKLDRVPVCIKTGCIDSTPCDISGHDDNEVFFISRLCEVGKINNDNRIRKKKVARITMINTTAIIMIKIPVVFIVTVLNWLVIKI